MTRRKNIYQFWVQNWFKELRNLVGRTGALLAVLLLFKKSVGN